MRLTPAAKALAKRILLVKTSSLGDVVHQCPAVSDAARSLGGATIDWVVEEAFAGIARMHAAVAQVIPVAVRRWRRALWKRQVWTEIFQLRKRLSERAYDAVIDTQGLLKSAVITHLSAGTSHGMDRASAREALAARFYDHRHAIPRDLHAVERNRRLTAAALGYEVPAQLDYGLRAPVTTPGGRSAPYAVLLTMTSRADKLWPEVRWIELGRALGVSLVLPWGSAEERARAERIARGVGSAEVAERMSLEALAGLFDQARMVVGLDSGLTHLAAALGVRTAAIFCGSDPALTGVYGGPRAANVGARGRAPAVPEVLQALR